MKYFFIILTLFLFPINYLYSEWKINSLHPNDEVFDAFRKQVINSRNMLNFCSRYPDEKLKSNDFPKLEVAFYKVKANDTIAGVASKTYLDMDTIISINSLASIHSWEKDVIIRIPNMRGIIYKVEQTTKVTFLSKKYKLKSSIIKHINNLNRDLIYKGEFIFIPDASLPREEKALFYTGYKVFAHPFINIPVSGKISSKQGWRKDPFTNKRTFHGGLDIASKSGTKVYAALDGTIEVANWSGGYGKLIVISHRYGYKTFYGHLSKINVKTGQTVRKGQYIGNVGSTGRSTGPHLHFEIRKNNQKQNPMEYMNMNHQ